MYMTFDLSELDENASMW